MTQRSQRLMPKLLRR